MGFWWCIWVRVVPDPVLGGMCVGRGSRLMFSKRLSNRINVMSLWIYFPGSAHFMGKGALGTHSISCWENGSPDSVRPAGKWLELPSLVSLSSRFFLTTIPCRLGPLREHHLIFLVKFCLINLYTSVCFPLYCPKLISEMSDLGTELEGWGLGESVIGKV